MKLVLLIEDEYGNAEVLGMLLEEAGFRVTVATNGKEGLEKLSGEKPALILSDFMMPYLTGAELGTAVRADSALADVPFVIITATTEATVQQRFKDYDAFVQKPYSADGLLKLIEHLATHGRPPPISERPERDPILLKILAGLKFE